MAAARGNERQGPPRRVAVLGSTGSGKTTLARRLGALLDAPHVELDALFWGPGWAPTPAEEFRAIVAPLASGERWVMDGEYLGRLGDLVLARADLVVCLDYSLPVLLWRLTRRSVRRVFRREELWNGNREDFRSMFLSRDSLYWWLLTTYRRKRRERWRILGELAGAGARVVRFRSPRATDRWLERFEGDCAGHKEAPSGVEGAEWARQDSNL